MSAYDVLFPAGMILAPAAFLGLWCLWTGVRGMRRTLFATLAVLVGFGVSGLLFGVSHETHRMFWGLGGLWFLLLGFAVPEMRRHVKGLPEVPPRGASLKKRKRESDAAGAKLCAVSGDCSRSHARRPPPSASRRSARSGGITRSSATG